MSAQSLPITRPAPRVDRAAGSTSSACSSSESDLLARLDQRLGNIEEGLRLLRVPLPSRCLKVKEVAEVLDLSVAAVQGLINRGELPALQLSFGNRKVFRVQLTDLNEFIEQKKAPTSWKANDADTISIPTFDD
jgi:excisionase family DNA binding protein